jgi:hypothetical protein
MGRMRFSLLDLDEVAATVTPGPAGSKGRRNGGLRNTDSHSKFQSQMGLHANSRFAWLKSELMVRWCITHPGFRNEIRVA